jgi:hypothetical protein
VAVRAWLGETINHSAGNHAIQDDLFASMYALCKYTGRVQSTLVCGKTQMHAAIHHPRDRCPCWHAHMSVRAHLLVCNSSLWLHIGCWFEDHFSVRSIRRYTLDPSPAASILPHCISNRLLKICSTSANAATRRWTCTEANFDARSCIAPVTGLVALHKNYDHLLHGNYHLLLLSVSLRGPRMSHTCADSH